MTLTQILQKIKSVFYTKAEVDASLSAKANDSDVVHKNGDETIGGVKNFFDNTKMKSINRGASTSNLSIFGGTTNTDGSSLYMYGADQTNGKGSFILRARNNESSNNDLVGNPNGSLTWNGKNVICSNVNPGSLSLPCDTYTDYSGNLVYQDYNNGYRFKAPYECLIALRSQGVYGHYLIVNDTLNIRSSVSSGYSGVNLFARKNDAIDVYCPSQSVNTGVSLKLFKLQGNV